MNERTRVALVARPAQGGIRSHLILLNRHLDYTQFQTRLLAPRSLLDTLPREATEQAQVLNVPAKARISDLIASHRLLSLLQTKELVHAHGIRAGWICALAHRRRRFPFVVTFHNLPPPMMLGQFAVSVICRQAGCLIAVSQAIAAHLPPCKTRIIPNGIEIDRFQGIDRDDARAALDVRRDAFAVGCIARLSREKGVDLVVEAARGRPAMQFIIAGDGPERAALERNAPMNVRFLGSVEDVASVLAALDTLVIPSRSEGQGIVALEAFAAGCPVAAARVGGLVETVRHETTGLLFEPGDVGALSDALDRLAHDSQLRDSLRLNADGEVQSRGSIREMCLAVEAVYRDVTVTPYKTSIK